MHIFFKRNIPTSKSRDDDICMSFLIKGLNKYQAIVKLCALGLSEDAIILNRSLWEYLISMYWLFDKEDKREERLGLFKDCGEAQEFFLVSQVPAIQNDKDSQERLAHLKSKFEGMCKKYGHYPNGRIKEPIKIYKQIEENYCIDDSMQSFKKMYDKVYPFWSSFAHPNAYAVTTSFEAIEGELKPRLGASFEFVKENLFFAGYFLRFIVSLYSRVYGFNFTELDSSIMEDLNSFGIKMS